MFLLFSEGLDDEGLYRISGLAMEVDGLKEEFEKSAFNRIFVVDTIHEHVTC